MIIDTLTLSTITTQTLIKKEANPTPISLQTNSNSDFMFGIEIWGYNLTDSIRHFDIFVGMTEE